jgi:hypothetical protein
MKAYELIDKPEKWTKGVAYILKNGNRLVNPVWLISDNLDNVKCMCLETTLWVAYPNEDDRQAAMTNLRLSIDTDYIYKWNDAPERTWEEVYGLLKELDI